MSQKQNIIENKSSATSFLKVQGKNQDDDVIKEKQSFNSISTVINKI